MIKNPQLLYLLYFLFVLSCNEEDNSLPPIACFTSPSTVFRNQSIEFNGSCSERAEEYFWDFGDGIESTQQIIQHVYKASGEYSVKLIVNKGEEKDSIVQKIVVNLNTNELACLPSYILGARLWPNQNYDSITFSYQANKSLEDAKWFYSRVTIHSARMRYEYSNNVLSRILFYTTVGINPLRENLIYTFNIYFNNLSKISRIDWLNMQGDSVRVSNFTYDENKRIKEIVNRYIVSSFQHKTSYEYGKDGNIARVFYLSPYSIGKPALVRENYSFDSSLPFYVATNDLRIYFEYILQVDPTLNNCKTARLYQAVNQEGIPTYYGGGTLTNLEGISLEHTIQLDDKSLVKQFSIANYSVSVPTIIQFRKVVYGCN